MPEEMKDAGKRGEVEGSEPKPLHKREGTGETAGSERAGAKELSIPGGSTLYQNRPPHLFRAERLCGLGLHPQTLTRPEIAPKKPRKRRLAQLSLPATSSMPLCCEKKPKRQSGKQKRPKWRLFRLYADGRLVRIR